MRSQCCPLLVQIWSPRNPKRSHPAAGTCFSNILDLSLQIAPETAKHIFECVQAGLYNTNHFFRVDKVGRCGHMRSFLEWEPG